MNTKQKEDILIAEYDKRVFIPYNDNLSWSGNFTTYKGCEKWIKENNFIGYKPELGWKLGLGDYRTNFHSLMGVVEKICKEKFDDGSEETSHLRTFGMVDIDGNFVVRFNRGSLFTNETLIGVTFDAVIDYITNKKNAEIINRLNSK